MQTKEEWRSAAMECGGPSGVVDGTVMMLLLFADNLGSTRPTQVVYLLPVSVCWKFIIVLNSQE